MRPPRGPWDDPASPSASDPSHAPAIEGAYGLSYDHVGAHTEEYVTVLGALLRGEGVDHRGEHFRVNIPAVAPLAQPVR